MSFLALSASFEYLFYGYTAILNILIPTVSISTLDRIRRLIMIMIMLL